MKMNKEYYKKEIIRKPKYKIGDIVAYVDRYEKSSMVKVITSEIIESNALLETATKDDVLSWYYITKEVEFNASDGLTEEDILYKL